MKDKPSPEALAFAEAFRRIPIPVTCFSDGAACPWCGLLHRTVTFGQNECLECKRPFWFGYPDWHSGKDPISFVPFPFKEWDALGGNPAMLEDWKPNDRLKRLYHMKVEEKTGIDSRDNPQ